MIERVKEEEKRGVCVRIYEANAARWGKDLGRGGREEKLKKKKIFFFKFGPGVESAWKYFRGIV